MLRLLYKQIEKERDQDRKIKLKSIYKQGDMMKSYEKSHER